MRTFSGQDEFDALKQTVVDSYSRLFPANKSGDPSKQEPSLHLKKIWVSDEGLDPTDYAVQKKARLAGQTWGAPVFADLELRDANGKVLDHMAKVRLATIPRLTPRGSYIVGGNEYQVSNQLRKRAGAYIQRRQTGDQFKAELSLKDGDKMRRLQIHYDPITAKFSTEINQSKVPLYPLVHALGVSDDELRKSWGSDLLAANKKDTEKDILRLADRFARVRTDNKQTAIEAIRTYAKKLKADPKVNEVTLGKGYDHLHPHMVMDAAKKLHDVYNEKALPDDPENLLFKEILSTEDMLHDLLNSTKKQSELKSMLTRKLGRKTSIRDLIDFRKLSSPVESFFTSDDRAGTPEQYNPVHMISEKHKLTFMGTGGITNPHAITNDVREVHPSHVGYIDPVHTPEGEKVGVTLHLTSGALKDGRDVRTRVINARTGKIEALTPHELYTKVVAFPDEGTADKGKVRFSNPLVRAQKQGKLDQYKPSQVDYIFPTQTGLFSYSTNLVPFLHSNQGNRTMMAAKMLGQALPLVEREAPNVQTEYTDGKTFHQAIGHEFSVHAPVDGKITAITKDHIVIGKHKVPIYHDFPLNQKTFITHEPHVKVGDTVKKGQLIADSNFTKNGTLAIGKNMRIAYLAYPGLTFEDGIVITESAAKKLATQQIYKHSFMVEPGVREVSFNKFTAHYPNLLSKAQRDNFDSDGVIKKGTVVKPGEVVIMGVRNDLHSPENMSAKRINKALIKPWANESVRYNGEFEGVVTDIVKRSGHVDVYVKATEIAKESDKLSGVHGNKGVITKVIPDHEAPRLSDGSIPDIFLNPHGIIGRMNPSQIYESAAGKIAQKTGKPYLVKNFDGQKANERLLKDMAAHGVTDLEDMVLPDGRPIGKVHVGNPFILRLAKTGKTGFSARMPGSGYDLNKQPLKGGEEGTKSVDPLALYCMLSHGAKRNLVDVHQKSEKNDEYWHAVETGQPLPRPKTTFAYEKFINLIKGSGINVIPKENDLFLAPMTDHDVKKMSRGEITEHNFFYGKDGKEIKGGYFDPVLTGGKAGSHFTHIALKEPMPNPVFEKPILSLTGLAKPDYFEVLSGTKKIKTAKGEMTGGAAIKQLLSEIEVEKEIESSLKQLETSSSAAKTDALNRKLRYLNALKSLDLKPHEAYVRTTVPVIPPAHRPVITLPGVGNSVAPANYLYQRLGVVNKSFEYPVMKFLDDSAKKDLRKDLYTSSKMLAGLEPLETRGKEQPIEGFISQITGSQPKAGFFLSKVVSRRQDLVGRGVITAAPDLHVDELGIPEKMAWKIFHPFAIREFTKAGVGADIARKELEQKTPRARQMLETAMKDRTVLMNRAPSLHKFSIMAFKPVISNSLAVRVPPLVLKGFGGDFDGDAVTIHVPTSTEAVRESYKMLPSNNLFKPGTGELMMVPAQESTIGLYFMSHSPEGRKKINTILPPKFHVHDVLDEKTAKKLYMQIAKEDPKNYADYVLKLKAMGDKEAYEKGFTVGIKDTLIDTKRRDELFKKADQEAIKLKALHKPGIELDHKIADVYRAAAKQAFAEAMPELKKNKNNFYHMVNSGARGKPSQLQQIIVSPGIVEDAKGRPVPVPIKNSYAEGVKTSDYFVASYGVRKGMLDKSLQTSDPGALNKDILASTVDNIITTHDCGTSTGLHLPITSADVYDRYLAHDQAGFKRNTLVTPQMITAMNRKGVKTLTVRSPLKCTARKGTCAHCFGVDEYGKLPELGDNVGAKSGQTMSEPMTQMTMKTFHTGGMAGTAPSAAGFERIKQILHMPESYLSGEAAFSTVTGKVTKITKAPTGATLVFVGDKQHVVPPNRSLIVKPGQTVSAGDLLSSGVMKPQNIHKFKGMEEAQNYMVDELHKTYEAQGAPMQRRVFETVVRSIGNMTRVVKAPKDSDFKAGDVVPFTAVMDYNQKIKKTVHPEDAVGYHLNQQIGMLPQYHLVKDKDVEYLRSLGHNKVDVVKAPVVHAPILKGIERLPQEKKNWMAQFGYRYISNALTEGAAEAWKSAISGTHPIPAFAHGAEFGKKKEHY